MPIFTLIFNIQSLFLLALGYYFIKKNNIKWHARCMFLSFFTSLLLLVLFIDHRIHHGFRINKEALELHFGSLKNTFLLLLITHIFAAILSGILSIPTLYLGYKGKKVIHKKIAPWTFYLWIYSSLTGVIVYLLMKQMNF